MSTSEREQPKTRIALDRLHPRTQDSSEQELQQTLKRLGAAEGAPCLATCDCQIGLVCRDGVCTADW
jgi:hypothetical protein